MALRRRKCHRLFTPIFGTLAGQKNENCANFRICQISQTAAWRRFAQPGQNAQRSQRCRDASTHLNTTRLPTDKAVTAFLGRKRMNLRTAVIGARRHHQGIGPYVARDLAALGCDVVAIVGTRPETLAAARQNLEQAYGIRVRGYLGVAEMLAREELDAAAICSPFPHHREHLQQCLEARLHVLCEKPLVFAEGCDPAADAAPLVEGFARLGKILMVNEQWPYTLPYFFQLYPEIDLSGKPPARLEMTLCPNSTGVKMLPDAMPHVLSMLFALAPTGGAVEDIRIESRGAKDGFPENTLMVEFAYRHQLGKTRVATEFRKVAQPPRPANYAIDGRRAARHIHLPGYTFSLASTQGDGEIGRSLNMEDPLKLLLGDFVSRVQQAGPPLSADPRPIDSLRILSTLYEACQRYFEKAI